MAPGDEAWKGTADAALEASSLWMALLGGGSLAWDRWQAVAEQALRLMADNLDTKPLQVHLNHIQTKAPLALWLSSVPLKQRREACAPLLERLAQFLPARPTEVSRPGQACARLCAALHCLFGSAGALWPLAPHIPAKDEKSLGSELRLLVADPALLALLLPPCAALLATLRMQESPAETLWEQLAARAGGGDGLLPLDLVLMLQVCQVVACEQDGSTSLAAQDLLIAAAVLQAALAETQSTGPASEAGVAALIGRVRPAEGLEAAMVFPAHAPTRMPLALMAAHSAEEAEASSLLAFARELEAAQRKA